MSEEITPEPTGEVKNAKDMLIKYIPERDYISRNYKPFRKGFSDMCGHCKHYYKKIHEVGLTSKEFPINCKGHIIDQIKGLKEDDFDNEEEFQEVITMYDPVSWAYKMFPDDFGEGWRARWYQEELSSCTADRKVVRAGRRCLKEGTMVATPSGPKAIEDFKIGDIVYDEYGNEIKVLNVYNQGKQEVVDLINHNHVYASATLDHRWLTHYEGRQVEKIRHSCDLTKRHRIVRKEIKSPLGNVNEPYAYVLGAMLGDGCCRSAGFCISSNDPPIVSHIANIVNTPMPKQPKGSYIWYMPSAIKAMVPHYLQWMDKKYTHEKIVDIEIIKSWDRGSLLQFVAGLIDTDGSVFNVNNKELVISIGMQAKSVIEATQYAFLALWQIDIPIRLDNRKKYKNGPIYELRLKHVYHCRRILKELTKYIQVDRKKYKSIYDNYNSNNFNARSLGVKLGNVYLADTWDLEVDSQTSLYLLANGLVTHNTGKSELICMMMMWMTHVNSNFTILVIVPYEAQVNLLWDKIMSFVSKSPEIESSISRSTKSPEHRLEFNNGSKIIGFSSGPSSAARSDKIRGQDANYIVLDEADYLAADDIEAILAILASHAECGMWASSTPTGKHDKFYQFATAKDAGFKEFHFTSAESPSWTESAETFFRTTYDAVTFEHEFLAEFGIQEAGVFRNDLIDASLMNYEMPREKSGPGTRVIIGVDWNGQAIGAHIVVTECVHTDKGLKYIILEKQIIKGVEFTQHESVHKIMELDKKYNADFVYIDHGYGEMQFEMLQMLGKNTPGSDLHKRVRAYKVGGSIEIKDPLSNKMIKKEAKPFMVNSTALALERGSLILPSSEDTQVLVDSKEDEDEGQAKGIVQQMRNFSIESYSSTGQPKYSQGEEHSLTAFMFSIVGFMLEFSDMKKDNSINEQILFIDKIDNQGNPVPKSKANEELSELVRQLGAGKPASEVNKDVFTTINNIKSNSGFIKKKISGGTRTTFGNYLNGGSRSGFGKVNSRRNF